MGEAKRRKQILGARYGQPPPLKTGSLELKRHVEKMYAAWEKKCAEVVDECQHLTEVGDNFQAKERLMGEWFTSYLNDYRPEDRGLLALAMLAPLYDTIAEIYEQGENLTEFLDEWGLGAILIYRVCLPNIPDEFTESTTSQLQLLSQIMAKRILDAGVEVKRALTR